MEQVVKKEPPFKRREEKIESIVETREGFLIGIFENSTNAEILGFVNPSALQDVFKRTHLGRVLKYDSVFRRDQEISRHRANNKTFVIIGSEEPKKLKNGKEGPDFGMLFAAGYNNFHDKSFLRIVGFYEPAYVKAFYEKFREFSLNKEEEEEERETFWPEPRHYFKKFGLGREWVGTTITKDQTSIKILDKVNLVKEVLLSKVLTY